MKVCGYTQSFHRFTCEHYNSFGHDRTTTLYQYYNACIIQDNKQKDTLLSIYVLPFCEVARDTTCSKVLNLPYRTCTYSTCYREKYIKQLVAKFIITEALRGHRHSKHYLQYWHNILAKMRNRRSSGDKYVKMTHKLFDQIENCISQHD